MKFSLISSKELFEKEFKRCSKHYQQLEMYTAWVGNPYSVVPFDYLHNLTKISAVVGIAFAQTHPDGIRFLMDLKTNLRIANEDVLFHPKVYIFTNQGNKAIFIGSSNFTYQGFYENHETNVLIEGSTSDKLIIDFENDVKKWRGKKLSFLPDEKWLANYTQRYKNRRQKLKDANLEDDVEKEEQAIDTAAWLAVADWDIYLRKFKSRLRTHESKYGEGLQNMLHYFQLYSEVLSTPWGMNIFDEKERRKMIGGMNQYAWLGHVAAAGDFRRMLAKGTIHEYKVIVNAINSIATLSDPLDFKILNKSLELLVKLGKSMKVWGRILAIVRPDLFCTISAPQVRKKLSKLIIVPERSFETVEGYLNLIKLIHSSPWYKSKKPTNNKDYEIWKRRVAFLDVIFYD